MIATATAADWPFLRSLQAKNSNTLGFLPREAVGRFVDSGDVILGRLNDDAAGYVLGTLSQSDEPGVAKVFQAAVELDARRESVGRELVEEFVRRAVAAGSSAVRLWCTHDNPAGLDFWAACGFEPVAIRQGGKHRKRVHVCFERRLGTGPVSPVSLRRRGLAGTPVLLAGMDGFRHSSDSTGSPELPRINVTDGTSLTRFFTA